jgi:hypothetical protein
MELAMRMRRMKEAITIQYLAILYNMGHLPQQL